METKEYAAKICHLLSNIESEDPEVTKTIESLRMRARAALTLAAGGHEVAAQLQINNLGPDLQEIIPMVKVKEGA